MPTEPQILRIELGHPSHKGGQLHSTNSKATPSSLYDEASAVSQKEALMRGQRFGRKIKLPSTMAIKHQLLTMMFEDEVRAIPCGGAFNEDESPALAMLKRLRGLPLVRRPAG